MAGERSESGSRSGSEVRRLISALERISKTRRSASFSDETLPRATANQLRILAELDPHDPVMVTELAEVGFTEFGLYYPTDQSQLEAFEAVAQDTLPALRSP